jgi:hypothetical protein
LEEESSVKYIALTKQESVAVDDSDYDALTRWKWHLHTDAWGNKYAVRFEGPYKDQKKIYMHRWLLGDCNRVDHRDRNGLNNQKSNLRRATTSLNVANRLKAKGDFTSKFKGVGWSKPAGKWRARVANAYIGVFSCEVTAALAYDDATRKAFGEFAQCNFPDIQPATPAALLGV